ncbi:hypothetical protein WJX75_006763 [Coccomyxa subellipsoidea]|uniref:AP2/ERF domain-containing protein n=1 Tax=Coccomyxa subellipsoidea TaxID=248742 RepID=A0ABR2YTR7_9CHLO
MQEVVAQETDSETGQPPTGELMNEFSRALVDNLNRENDEEDDQGDGRLVPANDQEDFMAEDQGSPKAPSRRGPRGTSSKYRGVTRHRRTKRWEAHIWDDKKQVYLGGFDVEEHAGKAHDVMALKCRGPNSPLNFALEEYDELLPMLPSLSKDEVVLLLRRQSKGFARGTSKYRGVVKQRSGKWDGRMGQYRNNRKYVYVGVYGGGEEGAAAFERAAADSNSGHSVSNLSSQAVGHCGHRHDQGNGRVEEWGQHGGGGGMDTMWAPSLPTLQQHQQQHRNHYAPPRANSPVQMVPASSGALSPSAQLLRSVASYEPAASNGFTGVYHPAEHGQYYPSQQTSFLQQQLVHSRSPYMAAGALLYSKDIVDHAPQQRGETRGMETYQSQDRHEAIRDNGMPAIAVAHMPPPLCTGLLAGNDSEHNGQLFTPGAPAQKGSDLHWHPSMISPALLRQAEAWSGGELVSNPSGHAAQVMTSHSGHHFILPEAADVAASIAAESHPSGSCQAAAAGGNAPRRKSGIG